MFDRFVQYDVYERHKAAALLLGEGCDGHILDIGGLRGGLAHFLPRAKVFTLNVDLNGDVVYGGKVFPFGANTFDSVVSLDTLEHISSRRRGRFVEECIRVTRCRILVAAPLATPGHEAYEARLDALHTEVHGRWDRMLHEHVLNGLPTEADLVRWSQILTERGFAVHLWYAGNYEWQCRSMERSLLLARDWGMLGKLANLVNLAASLAIWHAVVLSERPDRTTNRFYLLAELHGPGSQPGR
ncbi:MAG TPA: class I SAM-dependent methyltransferase [Phycisphaerae bacterium]|nr:class I SAM-dependent methyltransferase [Phycisphaerae bacterium]